VNLQLSNYAYNLNGCFAIYMSSLALEQCSGERGSYFTDPTEFVHRAR
jgi:hypothetical protein